MEHKTPLAIFKKTSGLTYDEIAKKTGESMSTLHKVSAGIAPMPLRTANAISRDYGVSRDWLRGEIKGRKPLAVRGSSGPDKDGLTNVVTATWTPGDIPPSPASTVHPGDKVASYIKALEAVVAKMRKVDEALQRNLKHKTRKPFLLTGPKPAPRGPDEKTEQLYQLRLEIFERDWKWDVASAFDWYTFTKVGQPRIKQGRKTINAVTKRMSPRMVGAYQRIARIERHWNAQKPYLSDAEPVDKFFRRKLSEFLSQARLVAHRPMLIEEVQSLLNDAARHPKAPLVGEALIAALQQIRQRFEIPRYPLTKYLTREMMTEPEPQTPRALKEHMRRANPEN